jgi:hypothetical protein
MDSYGLESLEKELELELGQELLEQRLEQEMELDWFGRSLGWQCK